MRTFNVVSANGVHTATLYFDTAAERGRLVIRQDVPVSEYSPLFAAWAGRGHFELTEDETDIWINERVCPSGRENIREILDRWGLDHYNQYLLSIAFGGECVSDHDHFEEV